MRKIQSEFSPAHRDYELLTRIKDSLIEKIGGFESLEERFPELIREVIDIIIDPVRTGRTRFEHLDNVEKTFIGLKVEHVLRDLLDVPSGLRDLIIDGMDVDVKNTVRDTWTIPPETYRNSEPCILIASDEAVNKCWLGLIVAREEYLTRGINRDHKKTVSAAGFKNILWILEGISYPRSRWLDIEIGRFRELRKIQGGTNRACQFFRENTDRTIHRSVVEMLLFDQKDYMKRVRGNGGARDVLKTEGIALLSGTYDSKLISELGFSAVSNDELIAVRISDARQITELKKRGILS